MANCCSFDMMVVSKKRESIERLFSILSHTDKEFYIYREDISEFGKIREHGGLWVAKLCGYVAWSCTPWISDKPNPGMRSDNGASYTNLKELCRLLDIGVEIWGSESGMQFQQYILIDNRGEVCADDTEHWEEEFDDDGELVGETGGFGGYGEWSSPEQVYRD